MRSIAVIGAGWYGCHIALSFKRLGYDVTLYEKKSGIFQGASGANQFRLHQGFHYARNHETRVQSRDGFNAFIETYPLLSRTVWDNLYIVPKGDSLLDFKTYTSIMSSSGIPYHIIDDAGPGGEGCVATDERVLLTSKAIEYFTHELGDVLKLNYDVHGGHSCLYDEDYVIDTTWGTRNGTSPAGTFFEPTLLLNYECNDEFFGARTYVDGPLCSIYPTEDTKVYTLSSVPYTPLSEEEYGVEEAQDVIKRFDSDRVSDRRELMEDQIKSYIPHFDDVFSFMGPQFSMKTKIRGLDDNRACYVTRRGDHFSVMSGKIDTIFHAFNTILNSIIRNP